MNLIRRIFLRKRIARLHARRERMTHIIAAAQRDHQPVERLYAIQRGYVAELMGMGV